MPEPTNEFPRREFLRHTARAAATAGLAGGAASAAMPTDKKLTLADTIPARVFGKTGVKLPVLGYGGAALPKAWGSPLSLEDRVKLVRYAYARGLRYFDTAGNYMESQGILGYALKPYRDKVWLATKVETTVPSQVRKAVERCLKELRTDYLDLVQIHGTPGLQQMSVARSMKVHAELVKLRDERIIRFIGVTAHGYFDKALAVISTGGFDQCMLAFGYLPRGHDQLFSPRMIGLREQCLAKAHQLKMGICAMKVIGAGVLGGWSGYVVPKFDKNRLKLLPGAAMRYVLKDKRVHMLTIGMRLKTDIDANIKTVAGNIKYTAADRALLAEFGPQALKSDAMKKMRVE
jgi:predicted aldo/keto reductase-like oxidoreductase